LPRRIAPKYYDVGPFFYGEDYETAEFGEEGRYTPQPRNELGRFTHRPVQVKDPTATIHPPRPRTHRGSYNAKEQTLRLQFRNGRVYGYYGVPANVWRDLKSVASTGRFINRRLDPFFEYHEEWPVDLD
jgi:hypothetical protein